MTNLGKKVLQNTVINALTIATALIWVDVIKSLIEGLVPYKSQLEYKFGAAVIATLLVSLILYVFVKAEEKAERVIKELEEEFGNEVIYRHSSKRKRRNKRVR